MLAQPPLFAIGEPSPPPAQTGIPLTVAEYFAGIGLVRLGLERAGWQVRFANDWDPGKAAMYQANFPNTHYVLGNIFDLEPERVPPTTLATCSFPFIDLSLAGKNGGLRGAHSSAFWGFIQLLQAQGAQRPPLVLLENVPGWITSNRGEDFRATIAALNELGYRCDVYTLDALHFTPQSRLRVFVVGVQGALTPDWALLDKRPGSILTPSLRRAIHAHCDLGWHFWLPSRTLPPPHARLGSVIEQMAESDPRWWTEEEAARHLAMMTPAHLERVQTLVAQPGWHYRTLYRRVRQGQQRAEVRQDEVAGCLRTARGGSSRQMLVVAGQGRIKMRHMTPREYARLQGVPDTFPIPGNIIQALMGFGDAVCVPVITWIAESVLNPMVAACASPLHHVCHRHPVAALVELASAEILDERVIT